MPEADRAAEAPHFMGLDGEAADIWGALYPEMWRTNLVKRPELAVVARYCKHVARWVRLSRKVDAAGETYETESKHGKLQRINPDLNALLRIEAMMLQIEDRFGLSPQARLRILSMKAMTGGQGDLLSLPAPEADAVSRAASSDANVVNFPGIGPVPARAGG